MGLHRVISIKELNGSAYILRFERKGMIFIPGQHVNIGIPGDDDRPFTIYSGINDDYLEVLIRLVKNGNISNKLKLLNPGDVLTVGEPHGSFILEPETLENSKFWFIATGTGISPFHCFVCSFPSIDYRIIHGIRFSTETYDKALYNDKYISCMTGESLGNFNGRLTEYLRNEVIDISAFYFLCGNYDMIDHVYDLLSDRGVTETQIKTEGYF